MRHTMVTIDGNDAAAHVAYRLSEVIAIYPITPSSGMGELSDSWAAEGRRNVWGTTPDVVEMQSEGGASGAVHGALTTGALTTTFTASQGLLLMIPNMFKIAGELTPAVFHVSARSVATHALSIFGDHSDVMATRSTGWGMLASGSVQEVMDLGAIAHAASLEARLPFVHFFDGFRTSHEVNKIHALSDEHLRELVSEEAVLAHRGRGLSPDRPELRGSAQNPDVFFQAREACNPYYNACAGIVQQTMDRFAKVAGRQYHLFDYIGAPDAERVIVMMGSGAETAHETVAALTAGGEKVGLIKVRLYRPFDAAAFLDALPKTVKRIVVLDRTKEPGAVGEPLYMDVATVLADHFLSGRNGFSAPPQMIGGRYGLSSKEFTPAMVKAVLDELSAKAPRPRFTVGIEDDVTKLSLEVDTTFSTERDDTVRAVFFGLGSDGTVGANKNSIKIIGSGTDFFAQGFFVYDSKKAGSITTSHLRFGPEPIRSTYLIQDAGFVAVHHESFLEKFDVLKVARPGATLLLNASGAPANVWDSLPREVQQTIIDKQLKVYTIDAYHVARELNLGRRINTLMQTCFFALAGVLPRDEAVAKIKDAIDKTYGAKGKQIVEMNFRAVDTALANLHEVTIPSAATSHRFRPLAVAEEAPPFVQQVTARMLVGEGDDLPVSALPSDGTFPTATARWEKRCIAEEIPIWDQEVCIQCGKCALVCPHAAIRMKVFGEGDLQGAPTDYVAAPGRGAEFKDRYVTIQVAPEDCTGCGICVDVCPAKNKKIVKRKAINMEPIHEHLDRERDNYRFFLELPEVDRTSVKIDSVKGSQFLEPLFEYSGACAGCGETPYVKLVSQLFGDRAVIANATGCSSIYGGNLPTTPWTVNRDGRGPAWSNSLFEDNAEFGLGFRLTFDRQRAFAGELLKLLADRLDAGLVEQLLAHQSDGDEAGLAAQRQRVVDLKGRLDHIDDPAARQLHSLADMLCHRSIWVIGGDGWAYDIGFGGLDHVLASGRDVNVLVLDTEVYSNTGGQCSKATPCGAVAKFAAAGKATAKKDIGLIAMSYGNVYVAKVAMGANDNHCVKAFLEAERYPGPSLILAYSHCIAHGINMTTAMQGQKRAVASGHWPLYRFDPQRAAMGKSSLVLDSPAPKLPLAEFARTENRFNVLMRAQPERAKLLMQEAQRQVHIQRELYEQLAQPPVEHAAAGGPAASTPPGGGAAEGVQNPKSSTAGPAAPATATTD